MTTRTWNGGSGVWTDPTQWAGGVVPLPDDTEIVAGGTLEIVAGGTLDAETLDLGSTDAAVLWSEGATFGYRFTIDSTGSATLLYDGSTAFNGTINATTSGGTFTLAAGDSSGADFVLLDGGAINVSGGDNMALTGTLSNHSTVIIGSGGDFSDTGTIAQSSAAFEVDSGGTLTGGGTFEIGFYSSLYFEAGAAASQLAVGFTDVAGRLFLADPAAYTGMISNFQQGDLIDLTATVANYATYDAATDQLTVEDDGSVVATLNLQGPASGVLTTVSDGASGTDIEVAGTQPRVNYTITADDRAMQSDVVRDTLTTAAGTPITGAGVKIGIISSSFDEDPTSGPTDVANAAAIAGYLPLNTATDTSAVTVLSDDLDSGDDNEGLAMAELAHQVAPGAQLYFATAEGGLDTFASAVGMLQQAGCQVIVDDIGYDEEPFFQNAGVLDTAIESAVASGVSYFTAAGNAGSAAFQAAFTPQTVTLDGSQATAEIFSTGSPYQTITLQGGVSTSIALQWATPWPAEFQSVTPQLSIELFDMNGNLLQTSTATTDAPEEELTITPSVTTQYQLAIVGTLAAGTQFKYMLLGAQDGGTTIGGTIDDPAANAGTIKGHAMLPDVNTVGAVDFTTTPVFGNSGTASEYYSDTGNAEFLYDSSGDALASPKIVSKPDFVAPVDAAASLTQFQPFGGTSAAAPNAAAVAALMLQADPALTPAQITSMLEQSATDLGLPATEQGSGVINADAAVKMALAAASCYAAGTRITTARGQVPVEQLRLGDRLITETGTVRPVRWLGHRRVDCRRHPRPHEVWPIRVQAHAFAPQRPVRDLLLSPDHAVKADGVLIPVRYLVNGATVAQVKVPHICYWHVELDRHDVILAEGLAAESYLDTGNRAAFEDNGVLHLHPDFARRAWAERGCAPLVLDGPLLARVHARLRARAGSLGHVVTRAPALRLRANGRLLPMTVDHASVRARLPREARAVHLSSRIWVPAQMGESDCRELGVAVAALTLDGERLPLDDPRLAAGWHAAEPDWRWTDGHAEIKTCGAREFGFNLVMTGRYWREPPADDRPARHRRAG